MLMSTTSVRPGGGGCACPLAAAVVHGPDAVAMEAASRRNQAEQRVIYSVQCSVRARKFSKGLHGIRRSDGFWCNICPGRTRHREVRNQWVSLIRSVTSG